MRLLITVTCLLTSFSLYAAECANTPSAQAQMECTKSIAPNESERKAILLKIQHTSSLQRAEKRKQMRIYMAKLSPEKQAIHHPLTRKKMDAINSAQRETQRREMREHWGKMSHEERKEMREEMKQRWKNMPTEEREKKRHEMRERFDNMSPEELKQFKHEM